MKNQLKKMAITGLATIMTFSFAIPAMAESKSDKSNQKNSNSSAQLFAPGQIKKIDQIIKNAEKKVEKANDRDDDRQERSQDKLIKEQDKAFSDSIKAAQQAFNQAIKQANATYNADIKSARVAFLASFAAAGNDQTARAAALATYRGALMTALQNVLSAKQAAISAFKTAIQNIHANQAPVANAQSITVAQNGSVAITLAGSDPEGAALTFSVVSNPIHGTLSGTGAIRTYVPNTNYNGSDSFTFKVNDGSLNSPVATVAITVTGINQIPVANAQSLTVAEDGSLAITLTGSDPEASALTFAIVNTPTHGILSGTGATRTYTPSANYNGSDSFTFKVNDGSLDSAVATISLTVTAGNDAPVADAKVATTTVGVALPITLTGSDIDGCSGQTFTYSVTTQPANGTVTPTSGSATCSNGILSAGVTYTPVAGFTGSNAFNFKFNDGTTDSASATVSLVVNP